MKLFNSWLLGVILLVVTVSPAVAQVTASVDISESPSPQKHDAYNSLLWQVTKADHPDTSYVFGTIHMIKKDDYFFTEVMQKAFDACESIVFEIKIDEMADMEAQFALMMQAFMDNGMTLKKLLSEEDYKVVQDHFKDMGLPLMFLERLKPMFLSALVGDTSPDKMASGEVVSYEFELMERAQGRDKEIKGLETMDFQMSVFDSIPYKVQAKMLVESIQGNNTEDDQFQKMVELYKAQDLQGLDDLISGGADAFHDYEDLLLTQRNQNWIPLMQEMMEKERTFFAVGAGHLAGKQGVIELLRAEGYTVTALKQQ